MHVTFNDQPKIIVTVNSTKKNKKTGPVHIYWDWKYPIIIIPVCCIRYKVSWIQCHVEGRVFTFLADLIFWAKDCADHLPGNNSFLLLFRILLFIMTVV